MTCCNHCRDSGQIFSRKTAEKELRKYRKKGPPHKSTRLLLDALKRLDIQGKSLLDIGGGVGMIQHELLSAGAASSTLIEASPAYLEVAEEESRRRGQADRAAFRYGDFVDLGPMLPTADIVTLDRVFCCYPHMKRLADASTAKAERWYGAVYPKERWYLRLFARMGNLYCRARSMDFRVYIHSAIDAAIRKHGFRPVYEADTLLWNVALYERQAR